MMTQAAAQAGVEWHGRRVTHYYYCIPTELRRFQRNLRCRFVLCLPVKVNRYGKCRDRVSGNVTVCQVELHHHEHTATPL